MKKLVAYIFIVCLFTSTAIAGEMQEYIPQEQATEAINLAPEQIKALCTMEKRLWGKAKDSNDFLSRIEILEHTLGINSPKNTASQRIEALKLASSRNAISGSSIPVMTSRYFRQRDIQTFALNKSDDVGLIDGLLRAWRPDLYNQLKEYRRQRDEVDPEWYEYN
ncbi:MAG: hypothetical protein PHV37_05095 [Candidatus Gastranaerophilales bacterium]|nr:hypothetical protein [Candidatus Gastranaerophilales bacterium]